VCVFFLERLLIFKNEVFPIRISRYDFLKTKNILISKVGKYRKGDTVVQRGKKKKKRFLACPKIVEVNIYFNKN
jgi:hypothetical protein